MTMELYFHIQLFSLHMGPPQFGFLHLLSSFHYSILYTITIKPQCSKVIKYILMLSVQIHSTLETILKLIKKIDKENNTFCLSLLQVAYIYIINTYITPFDYVNDKTIKVNCRYCVPIPRQYHYIADRQVVCWTYGILGRHIRKPIPLCCVCRGTV